jgi:hypothetical protein
MGNGNNGPAPSQTPMLLLGGLVLLLILLCCSSIFLSYSRTGNINIFSSSKEFTPEELAYAQAHGGAMPPGSSMSETGSSGLGLLDAFGVKQKCKVGPWSEWGACDANCGTTARRTRTRQVVTPAKNGGPCTDPLTESDLCTGLPSCEVPAINGQYEPCPSGSYLLDSYCAVEIPRLTTAQCEDMKQQAALGAVSLGAAGRGSDGRVDPDKASIAAGVAVGTAALASTAVVAGPALILTAGIMAAVAAAEVDCDAYVCPAGWHDTAVNRRCDREATPKCPPGGYKWDWTRRMCIMPSTGSLAPASSPSA